MEQTLERVEENVGDDSGRGRDGLLTLMGVLISNSRSQAVTETRLEELTREVREHNNFARRVPVVEEQIRVMDRRMTALEKHIG